jgi:putative SOS response-associated peptidase YedK
VTPDEAALERFWTLDRRHWNPLAGGFNVAPTSIVPIIERAADGGYDLAAARWGLVPHWWNREKLPSATFNARSEEVASKPMWRDSYRHRRCLMPALGWYEWQAREPQPGSTPRRAPKQPFYVRSDATPVVAFAGLTAVWRAAEGDSWLVSCALLTRPAAPVLGHIHDRMPVVLPPAGFAAWLAPDTSIAELDELLRTAREDFTAQPVSPDAAVPDARVEVAR